ncbi:MAG: GNAT family N-acetyltransferase [Anaerolineae bacterium]|nr:GNAT family N-acetyltransferase [Anaerolineae bacterium]
MTYIFQGKCVRLRAVEPDDWQIHDKWNYDSQAARATYEVPFPTSVTSVQAWSKEESTKGPANDCFRFQVENLDGELVGTINTHSCDLRNGTFRYGLAILPDHQRHGYATEAVLLVLRYFFLERRYNKVNVEVYGFNEASIALHERLGFVLEGRLRQVIYTDGVYHDSLQYGLTRDEYFAKYRTYFDS